MDKEKSTECIPHGVYCYTWLETPCNTNNFRGRTMICPYWEMRELPVGHEFAGDRYGYCKYMEAGDGDDGLFLLFDQVKECGINDEDDEIYE